MADLTLQRENVIIRESGKIMAQQSRIFLLFCGHPVDNLGITFF